MMPFVRTHKSAVLLSGRVALHVASKKKSILKDVLRNANQNEHMTLDKLALWAPHMVAGLPRCDSSRPRGDKQERTCEQWCPHVQLYASKQPAWVIG